MREVQMQKVIVYRQIAFDRGRITEGLDGFHSLEIEGTPRYDMSNWSDRDLADLRNTITVFLDTLKNFPRTEEQKRANASPEIKKD